MFRALGALCGLLVAGSISPRIEAVSDWPIQLARIESPAAAESGQAQLSVSSRGVILSWIERTGAQASLRFSGPGIMP